jgi:hypothetical protein
MYVVDPSPATAGARIRLSETSVEHATLQDGTNAAKAMQAAEKLTMEMNASDYSMKSRTVNACRYYV